MWNLIEANKTISNHAKVSTYKKHLANLNNIKSQIVVGSPLRPTFSLSKRKNKYFKYLQHKISDQNRALLNHMLHLEAQPMRKTCNHIPLSIPSNKASYSAFKVRQRRHTDFQRNRQNEVIGQIKQKLLNRIQKAESNYGKKVWEASWNKNCQYKNNLLRKQKLPELNLGGKQQRLIISRPTNNPNNASERIQKII